MKDTAAEAGPFKYNLSAFLSAARSVTLFLQKEYAATPGFEEWWAARQVELRADTRMSFFNEKRVETIHIRPLAPAAHVLVEVHEVIHMTDAILVQLMDKDGKVIEERRSESSPAPPPTPLGEPRPPRIEWRWHFDELPDIEVVTASEEQLRKLRRVLDECEDLLGKAHRNEPARR
jgi:hypothetical protein